MKGIVYENAKQLAQVIYDTLKMARKEYSLRPFNRFDMEKSMWWIIPSKEFPAYQYGKYMVDENSDGTYSVGLHIEKGFEKAIEYKEKLMLDMNWVWHEFIGAVVDGEISRLLQGIKEKVNPSIEINIVIDIPKIVRSKKILLNDQGFFEDESGVEVAFESIPYWLKGIDGIEWYWVDFYIHFRIPKFSKKTEEKWTDYEIVENLLAPFEKWIR
jgi:hypothetical protein